MYYFCLIIKFEYTPTHTLAFFTTHLIQSTSVCLLISCQLIYSLANNLNIAKVKIHIPSIPKLILTHKCFKNYCRLLFLEILSDLEFCVTIFHCFPSFLLCLGLFSHCPPWSLSLLFNLLPKEIIKYAGTSLLTHTKFLISFYL